MPDSGQATQNPKPSPKQDKKQKPQPKKESVLDTAAMLLIKSIAMVLAVYLLSLPTVGVINFSSLGISLGTFISTRFLFNFLIIFFVALVFDAITGREDFAYQDFLGGAVGSLLITTGILPFQALLLFSVVMLCASMYVCFWIGKLFYDFLTHVHAQKAVGALVGLLIIFWIAYIILTAFPVFYNLLPQNLQPAGFNSTLTYVTAPNSTLVNYTLGLINADRRQYNLSNVSLSQEPSGQQHAVSMLEGDYFSHWDPYGMKPYMRYTLLGGRGAVSENVAYVLSYSKECVFSVCSNVSGIDIKSALQTMEYNMMYNDSVCCNNGHRDNILNPSHNQVSIGVAYSGKVAYLVEDFIDNYVTWDNSSSGYGQGILVLSGNLTPGYSIYTQSPIQISYDAPVANMTVAQLDNTTDYAYGNQVACVVDSGDYYCPNTDTIVADQYSLTGQSFKIAFDMSSLTKKYGAGEYTVGVWLYNSSTQTAFLGSTYTLFINSTGGQYFPSYV